jgi:hypothetical protein
MGAVASRLRGASGAGLAGGLVLAATVVALLVPFVGADPPVDLTYSNARVTDEGFNLNNARQRALFGSFATGDVDRSLTNGAYSAIAAVVFLATEPTLAAGRCVSVAAVAVAVLLLAWGLAEPLGRAAAFLSAAALAGANLALEYGRLGMVEPTVLALLTGGFVLAVRAVGRRSPLAGAGCGLLLAAAVSAKATAVVPAVAMLGVVLGAGLLGRDRRAVLAGLAALGGAVAAAAGWFLLVALPNLERLRVALRIWPRVSYPHTPAGVLERLGDYLAFSDHALNRSTPLLLGALVGLGALGVRWRALDPAARAALVMAGLWGFGLWLALAAGSGHQREADQRTLAAALPPDAVVFGHYAPTLLFDTNHELMTLWPSAGANAGDPVARFGATHVLASAVGDRSDPTLEIPALRRLRYQVSLPRVRWGSHTLQLYRLPTPPPPAQGS